MMIAVIHQISYNHEQREWLLIGLWLTCCISVVSSSVARTSSLFFKSLTQTFWFYSYIELPVYLILLAFTYGPCKTICPFTFYAIIFLSTRFSLSMYGEEQADAGRDYCRTRLARPNSQARTRTGKFQVSLFS